MRLSLKLLWLPTIAATIVAVPEGLRAQGTLPRVGEPPAIAERVYTTARPRLLQIRTVLESADRQTSIGSGFLVSADGLAVTNYHVVSQFALEPKTYRLQYLATDGGRGPVELLAIDVANDLALVRIDRRDQPIFEFDPRALAGELIKGESLYSMGNPLDLGFTIIPGTYNGLVERSYNERIHFSGAINPGMSGGPTLTAEGRVAGINVAKQVGGELVSFLVPARFAAALIAGASEASAATTTDFRGEIGRQLVAWQAGLFRSVEESGFRPRAFGPYQAPESAAPWMTCWAQTNADDVPKPRATVNMTSCYGDTRVFIANDLSTGGIRLTHAYVRSIDLNAFQFAAFLSPRFQATILGPWSRKWLTQQRCHEDFVTASTDGTRPRLRAAWCARAYRDFADLYDISMLAVTEDSGTEAMVSRMSLQGVSFENGMTLTRQFLEAVQWTKPSG